MRYEFHPEAEVDLIETILYYETQALGLGSLAARRFDVMVLNRYTADLEAVDHERRDFKTRHRLF